MKENRKTLMCIVIFLLSMGIGYAMHWSNEVNAWCCDNDCSKQCDGSVEYCNRYCSEINCPPDFPTYCYKDGKCYQSGVNNPCNSVCPPTDIVYCLYNDGNPTRVIANYPCGWGQYDFYEPPKLVQTETPVEINAEYITINNKCSNENVWTEVDAGLYGKTIHIGKGTWGRPTTGRTEFGLKLGKIQGDVVTEIGNTIWKWDGSGKTVVYTLLSDCVSSSIWTNYNAECKRCVSSNHEWYLCESKECELNDKKCEGNEKIRRCIIVPQEDLYEGYNYISYFGPAEDCPSNTKCIGNNCIPFCENGKTKKCIVDSKEGKQTCKNGGWSGCVIDGKNYTLLIIIISIISLTIISIFIYKKQKKG